jgi:hypothetical protein
MHVASDAVGIGVPAQVEGSEYTLSAVPERARTAAYPIGIMLLASNISLPVFADPDHHVDPGPALQQC